MKYIIHSCNKRLWYVKEYLVKSLVKQGINSNDIVIYNDDNNEGNLASWIKSCKWVVDNLEIEDGCWHLQDDVFVCKNFKDITMEIAKNKIICGYVNKSSYKNHCIINTNYIASQEGIVDSFQCIYIPNYILKDFIKWFEENVVSGKKFQKQYKENKYDDYLFKQFIRNTQGIIAINLNPSLVEHIDYILGGSIVNESRTITNVAQEFNNYDELEKLKIEIGGKKDGN